MPEPNCLFFCNLFQMSLRLTPRPCFCYPIRSAASPTESITKTTNQVFAERPRVGFPKMITVNDSVWSLVWNSSSSLASLQRQNLAHFCQDLAAFSVTAHLHLLGFCPRLSSLTKTSWGTYMNWNYIVYGYRCTVTSLDILASK